MNHNCYHFYSDKTTSLFNLVIKYINFNFSFQLHELLRIFFYCNTIVLRAENEWNDKAYDIIIVLMNLYFTVYHVTKHCSWVAHT